MLKRLIPVFFKSLSFMSPTLAAILASKLFTHPRRKKRSKAEMDFLATGTQVTFNSKRKARIWGQGSVVWVVHGWESRGSTFYKLIPELLEKNLKVIAWDAYAHGDSPGSHNTVPKNAQDLSQDMNQGLFDEPIAIVGHSFGGATIGVLSKIHLLPPKVVIASAPTQLNKVFYGFAKLIKLSKKATDKFIAHANSQSPYSIDHCSLVNNDLSQISDVLVIHDTKDDVIDFSDFIALKKSWKPTKMCQFVQTENLGHRLTIKDTEMTKTIAEFITAFDQPD